MAEVDRFTKKIHLGYPDQSEEARMLDRVVGGHPIEELEPVTDVDTVRRARATASAVTVNEPIREYASRLADYTRENARLGVSPRGSIALLRSAQARAVLDGRDYVVPDDVQSEAPTVLAHRVRVADGDARPEAGARVVGEALESVPVE
jgi:MoxR-like ATPase